MFKLLKALLLALAAAPMCSAEGLTLARCEELARENYPLIRKYGLVESTEALALSDINRGWLPRIGVYAQGTVQNAVPAFPDALGEVMDRLGQDLEGLSKLQWKAGVEISQTIWDGGASRSRRRVERASARQSEAELGVELYDVCRRVEELFFGILLMQEQLQQNELTISLLEANHKRLLTMLKNGTAMRGDAEMIEARLLSARQRQTEAQNAANNYRSLLELYIGEPLEGRPLDTPELTLPAELTPERPELRLFEARTAANNARMGGTDSAVMPKIGFFAQGYYGYPGFDYFKSMTGREASLNLLAGIKITWNIDAFYTRKNTRRRLELANEGVSADRETFLFNNRLQSQSELNRIDGLKKVIADDARIIELMASVRNAAESQLANGVIDTTALLSKITDENQARLTAAYHKIQLLQYISNLKHILNR